MAFTSFGQRQADALLVAPDVLFTSRRIQFATLAARYVVPTMYSDRRFVEAGGLMSYGTNLGDISRQTGVYAGRILKGENPANLPVIRASTFELVINLQTAKVLGLERDRNDLGGPPRQQCGEPGPMFGAMDLGIADDGQRACREQAAQIAIALFADAADRLSKFDTGSAFRFDALCKNIQHTVRYTELSPERFRDFWKA